MLGQRANDKFNRLLQKEGNITWSSTPSPPKLGNSMGPVSAPSQPGGNAGRADTHSQAGSVSLKAGSASSQAGRLLQSGRSAGKCRCSVPGSKC